MKVITLVVVLCATVINGSKLPSSYSTCKLSQPDFEQCACKAITDALRYLKTGDKDLGIPKIEPLLAKEIHIPGNGGKVDLDQKYMALNIFGLSEGTAKSFKLDLTEGKCTIVMDTIMPSVSLIGSYKMVGKLLIFTLNGFGKSNVTITNLAITHNMKCEKITKKNDEYISFTSYFVDLKPETLSYDFENLVNGNVELSAQVLQVVNDNPLDIFAELKTDYGKTFGEIFKQLAQTMFSKVPISEIFPA